jgi:hypothetical protein
MSGERLIASINSPVLPEIGSPVHDEEGNVIGKVTKAEFIDGVCVIEASVTPPFPLDYIPVSFSMGIGEEE